MSDRKIARRTFLHGASFTALCASGLMDPLAGYAQISVPNSAGTELPKLKAPALACDCHQHIYDPARFTPVQPGAEPNARVIEYRLLQQRIGTTRNVVVTPRPYGTDNRVTLDAIAQLSPNARGVAVINPSISDAELETLNRGGIRGIRFSLSPNATKAAVTTIDMIEPLSKRVNALGWHIQIAMLADQIAAAEDLWNRVPSPIVFDHMGQLPLPDGLKHPAYKTIRKLIDKGRTWVKVSVATTVSEYLNSKNGAGSYDEATKIAQAYVQAAPERMVWGSNWPHPGETPKPDDAVLFDLLTQWAPDEATRHRILVENPAILYDFPRPGRV